MSTIPFNDNDKIGVEQLAPSVQTILENTVDKNAFDAANNKILQLFNQLESTRVTIGTQNSVAEPQNNKELLWDKTTDVIHTYANGWIPAGGVYS